MQTNNKMPKAQRYIINWINKLNELNIQVNAGDTFTNSLEKCKKIIETCELIVPIVGIFSSGKSTMLNHLMGDNILPTALRPETSLATEIRYGKEPHLCAITQEGKSYKFEISDIKKVCDQSQKWSYLEIYTNNDIIKNIEPIILVDMPGFDSPVHQHNNAIMDYLDKGCYSIVLCSIEEGSITRTLLQHLQEISSHGRKFSFFVTKADLRSQEIIEEICEEMKNDLKEEFDFTIPFGIINNKNIDSVARNISALNPDKIFIENTFQTISTIGENYLDIINIKINSSKKDIRKLENIIIEMKESIIKLHQEADNNIKNIQTSYSFGMINDIVSAVGKDLNMSVEELVNLVESGQQQTAQSRFNDIIRTSLFSAVQTKIGEVNLRINQDFSSSLGQLDTIMRELKIDEEFIKGITEKIQVLFSSFQTINYKKDDNTINALSLASPFVKMGLSKAGASSILAVTGNIVAPILNIVMLFLPNILNILFQGFQQQRIHEALRNKIISEIIPNILFRLRKELPSILEEQIKIQIENVKKSYELHITEKKEAIDAIIEERKKGIEINNNEKNMFESCKKQITEMLSQLNNYKTEVLYE